MKAKNKKEFTGTRDEAIAQGLGISPVESGIRNEGSEPIARSSQGFTRQTAPMNARQTGALDMPDRLC